LDKAVDRDVKIQQDVADIAELAIQKLPGVVALCTKPGQLLTCLRANDVAYETYKKVRGLTDGGISTEGDDRMLDKVRKIVERNRAISLTKREALAAPE
jgi:hypothetical protein